jgi:UTP--glucose-1-phosphate uridylyltransferase
VGNTTSHRIGGVHSGLEEALRRMRDDRAPEAAQLAFRRAFERLERGDRGTIHGDAIEPVGDLPSLGDLPQAEPALLDRAVVVKVNGGLATTMGLSGPKSLLHVQDGRSFLSFVVASVLALREHAGARLPLVLMDSWRTHEATRAALARQPAFGADVPAAFVQHRVPRLRAADLRPVAWPAEPGLAWCPPGHGDVYAALGTSGVLGALLERGYEVTFLSNADNLGAVLDPRILTWFVATGVPFAMEVVRGTEADRKGGHVARRDGRLLLRESAQVPEEDDSFRDVERWRWYNANNLWIRLPALAKLLAAHGGTPDLATIVNAKRLDETNPDSPKVLQLETAMGSLVALFGNPRLLHVPRTRFVPVKGTDDLLLVRSDAYAAAQDGRLIPAFEGDASPYVELDPAFFGRLDALERRMPCGPPSLRACRRFVVRGDVTFGRAVVARGEVEVRGPGHVPDGALLEGIVRAA